MPPGDIAPVILVSLLALVTGAVLIFRGPVGRAMARRIEGTTGDAPELEGRLQEIESRLQAAETERNELLERVEFAERMLLTAREQPKELPR